MDSSGFTGLASALGSSASLLHQILGQVPHPYVDRSEGLPGSLSAASRRFHGLSADHFRGHGGERDGDPSRSRAYDYDPDDYERERGRSRERERSRDRERDRERRNKWHSSSSRSFDLEKEQDRSYRTHDKYHEGNYYPRGKYGEDRRSDRLVGRLRNPDDRSGEADLQDVEERSSFFGGLLEKGKTNTRDLPREAFMQPRNEPHRGSWEQRHDGPRARAAMDSMSYGFMDPMQIPPGALVRPHCYLEPPPVGMYKLPQREKPQSCRTAFIGGLPDMVDEVIINEIFFVCGPIESIKINKTKRGETEKKYCHVRFLSPDSVDQALLFAGFNLVIGDGKGRHKVGRFHVDYGQSKEDEKEYEALERAKAKEKRQKALEESDITKSTNIVFTDHEATVLLEKIRQETYIFSCLQVLEQWLEKGECSRKTASTFYSLLSSTHSHVKRLIKEKKEHEELVKKQKQEQLERAHRIKDQCGAIVKVFESACKKKAWDHFTKAQRRNITTWHQQVQEEVRVNEEVQIQNRVEVGMELDDDEQQSQESIEQFSGKENNSQVEVKSEGEDGPPKAKRVKIETDDELEKANKHLRSQVSSLKSEVEKNSSLVWQVEGYKNEAEQFKQQYNWAIMEKNAQIAKLTAALQGLQQFLQNVDVKNPLKDTHNLQILVTNRVANAESVVDIEDEKGDSGKDTANKENDDEGNTETGRREDGETKESAEQNDGLGSVESQDIAEEETRQEDEKRQEEEEPKVASGNEAGTERQVMAADSSEIEMDQDAVCDEGKNEEQQEIEEQEDSTQATVATKSGIAMSSDEANTGVSTLGDETKSDGISGSGDPKTGDLTEARDEDVTTPSEDVSASGGMESGDVTESRDEDVTGRDEETPSEDVSVSGGMESGDVTESRDEGVTRRDEAGTSDDLTVVDDIKSDDIAESRETDVTRPDEAGPSDERSVSGDMLSRNSHAQSRNEHSAVTCNEEANGKEELREAVQDPSDSSCHRSWNSFDWSGYSRFNNPANAIRLSGRELAVVGVLCSFLHICPSGATEEEVAGFVQNRVKGIESDLIRRLLGSLPMLFRPSDGKWLFCGFDSVQP